MGGHGEPNSAGALIRADHPFDDAVMAELYDAMGAFDADLPLYLQLAAAQGGRVLEIACGSGRVAIPLARAGHLVTGVDASTAMLGRARHKLALEAASVAERVRLIHADMRTFELAETFDLAIVAVKSFAYLVSAADQERALRAIAAHLRPGGLLALDLLHPSPAWLLEPPGSLRQDIVHYDHTTGRTVARTEAVVSTDLAAQVRVIRSAYEIVARDGTVIKRFVEWPYRYLHRFEAQYLLERVGLAVEAVHGGYAGEPFVSGSPAMLFLARKPAQSA